MTGRLTCALTLAIVTSAALFAQQPSASQPQPSGDGLPPILFRSEVNYVEVDAFVADAGGKPVTGLTAADFEVREDGAPQRVTTFSSVELPVETMKRDAPVTRAAGDRAPEERIDADVQTNQRGEGRIYLLVMDDLNTAFEHGPRVKAAVRNFIEQRFGANDVAAVAYTGRAGNGQDFTADTRLLLASIDRFMGRKLQSETDARREAARSGMVAKNVTVKVSTSCGARWVRAIPGLGLGPGEVDPMEVERSTSARSSMKTIRRLADFMANVRGRRKAMLLVGEGIDFNVDQVGASGTSPLNMEAETVRNSRVAGIADAIRIDAHDAIAAATRGNVSIYALDPRGLPAAGDDEPTLDDCMILEGPYTGRTVEEANGLPDKRGVQEEIRRAQNSLRSFADNTGGFAAVNQNDLSRAFDRIVTENSAYYVLGYSTSNARRDGQFRKLDVRVKRPGLRVRARSGYYEAKGGKASESPLTDVVASAMSPAVAAALGSPLPVATLPLTMFAAPFRGEGREATVGIAVEVEASKLDMKAESGDGVEKRLEVVFAATNADGEVFQQKDPHAVRLGMPTDAAAASDTGLRVRALADLTLPPGRYQLRAAIGNRAGRAGSVIYDLEVPDFWDGPLTMSGVVVASKTEGQSVVLPKALAEILPGPPTAVREFVRGQTLGLFTEIYENVTDAPVHTLELRMELRAEDGHLVDGIADEQSSADRPDHRYRFTPSLPLDGDIAPGRYVLHLEARTHDASVSRNIRIRIR